MSYKRIFLVNASIVLCVVFLASLLGCGSSSQPKSGDELSGRIRVDGSSTVYPITEAMAEEFQKLHNKVEITVGISGTGGGFKKFCNQETDMSDASRPIKAVEEEACKANGVEFIELPVAFDGLSVVVNPKNNWCDYLTVEELRRIWEPGSKINNWKDIRPGFPDKPLKLYGAGTDSGTFDYFTEAICGEEGASRSDYQASEDDNTLVMGVAGDEAALGYFGYAYYEENVDKLKLVAIDGGGGPVAPSPETINNGSYAPLSRPLFIYVSVAAAARPEVQAFVQYILSVEGSKLVRQVGYIELPSEAYDLVRKRFEAQKTGSIFTGGSQVGVKLQDILSRE